MILVLVFLCLQALTQPYSGGLLSAVTQKMLWGSCSQQMLQISEWEKTMKAGKFNQVLATNKCVQSGQFDFAGSGPAQTNMKFANALCIRLKSVSWWCKKSCKTVHSHFPLMSTTWRRRASEYNLHSKCIPNIIKTKIRIKRTKSHRTSIRKCTLLRLVVR